MRFENIYFLNHNRVVKAAFLKSIKRLPKIILLLLLISFIEIISIAVILIFKANSSNNRVLSAAKKIEKSCNLPGSREMCYADKFYALNKKNSLIFSLETLHVLQEIDPRNSIGCHFIAHKISSSEVEKNPGDWKNVLKEVRIDECTGGFMHGVMEAHLASDPDFKVDKNSADLICNKVLKDSRSGERSCNHIMGHLMLSQFNADEKSSVAECLKFPLYMPQYECLSGSFMENLTRDYLVAHGISQRLAWTRENANKIEKLCNEFSGLPQKACWKEISYLYWSIDGTDQDLLYKDCQRSPNQETTDECFLYGAGNMISSFRFDPIRLPEVCTVYDTSDARFTTCVNHLVNSLMATSIKNLDNAINLCTNIESSADCFSALLNTLAGSESNTDAIKKVCGKTPKDFMNNYCSV